VREFCGVIRGERKLRVVTAGLVSLAAAIILGLGNAVAGWSQSQAQNAGAATPVFEFDVASVKPLKSPDGGWGLSATSDGLNGTNVPLLYLIQSAYEVFEKDRLVGAPNWAASENYDIAAKMDASTVEAFQKLSKEQRAIVSDHMLQTLLADRFKLTIHRETRELPIYLLVIGKGGPKLQDAKPDPGGANNPHWDGTVRAGAVTMIAHQMNMPGLASALLRSAGRTVVDRTGLTGKYEFTLQFNPDDSQPESSSPGLFTALQEQLGLKLESGKSSVEVIVIDHVERPSGN
jgi:uncharacterized protein (TIGR03435 family)